MKNFERYIRCLFKYFFGQNPPQKNHTLKLHLVRAKDSPRVHQTKNLNSHLNWESKSIIEICLLFNKFIRKSMPLEYSAKQVVGMILCAK